MSIYQLLEQFLLSNKRNSWLETAEIKVYVRKAFHRFGDDFEETFDLASVIVAEDKQGCGIFKDFMLHLETLGLTIYVESIINKDLADMLERNGYTLDAERLNAWKRQ